MRGLIGVSSWVHARVKLILNSSLCLCANYCTQMDISVHLSCTMLGNRPEFKGNN